MIVWHKITQTVGGGEENFVPSYVSSSCMEGSFLREEGAWASVAG